MAQKNHSYFGPTIYQSFVVNYDINYFPLKGGPLNLTSQIAMNIPVVLPSYPIKIWGKSVKVFLSYDGQTNNSGVNKGGYWGNLSP